MDVKTSMPNTHYYQEQTLIPNVSGTLIAPHMGGGAVFLDVWDSPNADAPFQPSYNAYQIHHYGFPGPDYGIGRMCLLIDTSFLGANSQIVFVNLMLYLDDIWDLYITDPHEFVVQNGQPTFPSNPIVIGDFDRTHYSGNGGSVDASTIVVGWNALPFNATGLTWINKTGYTKLIVRNSLDVAGTPPTLDPMFMSNASWWGGGANRPYLDIGYIGGPHASFNAPLNRTAFNAGGFGKR